MNPLQTVNCGTSFPKIKPVNGSIFIRTDLPGAKVFQYDAKNDVYVQLEGIHIKTFGSLNPTECVDYYVQVFASMQENSYVGPYYGYKGILTDRRYRYRLHTDWDTLLYTSGYVDPVPYAPTYEVDGHYVCEVQWEPVSNTYKEIVVESSTTQNPGFANQGSIGDIISTLSGTDSPVVISPTYGFAVSDHHATYSGHESVVLFNDLSDFGYSTLSREEISELSRGTK